MTDEEKKAIEVLEEAKDRLVKPKMLKDVKYTNEDFAKAIDIILNLLDKKQKEIEDLKEINNQLSNYLNDSYYVSADEVRKLLEDMKERANNFSYETEILWRKIEKAENKFKEE